MHAGPAVSPPSVTNIVCRSSDAKLNPSRVSFGELVEDPRFLAGVAVGLAAGPVIDALSALRRSGREGLRAVLAELGRGNRAERRVRPLGYH